MWFALEGVRPKRLLGRHYLRRRAMLSWHSDNTLNHVVASGRLTSEELVHQPIDLL